MRPTQCNVSDASVAFQAGVWHGDTTSGNVTMTSEVGTDGATTLSRMNLSGYVGYVTISS